MRIALPKVLCLGLVSFLASAATFAQQFSPQPLITQPINENQLVALRGNTHPLAQPQFDVGPAPGNLPMQRMLLVLKRDPQQEFALHKLLDDQQDKASPNYHKWLTPDEFGLQFGPSDQDVQAITGWLQAHGFEINGVTHGRTVIEFSGVESQVEQAFHAQIHQYFVNGHLHWANASDPQIPTALTPAVVGIRSLHDFRKKPQLILSPNQITAKYVPGGKPLFSSGSLHALTPADFNTIYNHHSLGSGAKIAIVGRSNINLQDIVYFHYWMYDQAESPQVILNGPDPGDLGGSEEAEAVLDTTWSGAVAPSAGVTLVVSASTNSTDGVDLSEEYIIDNNLADIMSESFGGCEANYTSSEAAAIASLAQQAAAQGITYLVSSGDSGAEGCDDPNTQTVATHPASVNILASPPYVIAVGGTMFNENGHASTYWSSTNDPATLGSALSYIPEDAWDESCTAAQCGSKNAGIWAGGGGASTFFPKPSWQTGVSGIPADNARDLPDVSLSAAGHDPYLLCLDGSCVPDSQGLIHFWGVSGTSVSAPAFAGIMAGVGAVTGSRQGQANYVLYRLAASENLGQCNGSNTSTLPASSCVFNDVTKGNNAVPGETGYGTNSAQFQAGSGYDLATGLGSVNVSNLLAQWNTVTFRSTSTTFSISPTNAVHGAPLNVTGAVTANSGTPSGVVWLLEGSSNGNLVGNLIGDLFPLNAQGSFNGVTHILPGGTYQVSGHYPGDGTYGASDSSPMTWITIQPESTTTSFAVMTKDSTGNLVPFTSGPYGTPVYFMGHLGWTSGYGKPSAYMIFWDNNSGIAQAYMNGSADVITQALTQIPAGSHSITAAYYGDSSFSTSSNLTPINFSITKLSTITALNAQQTAQSLLLTATVNASGGGSSPTGPVTFTSGTTVLGTVYLTNGSSSNGVSQATATFDASRLAAGQYSVIASYPGDTDYTASTSPAVPLNLTADFTIADRGITSQTVAAGTTANYINDLAVTAFFGFSGSVTVSCSVPAKGTTCTVNPNGYTLDSTTFQGVGTVSVTTTSRLMSSAMRGGNSHKYGLWAYSMIAFSALGIVVCSSRRRVLPDAIRRSFVLGFSLVAFGLVGCGGGTGSSGGGGGGGGGGINPNGTPIGTYTVTVTGTSGGSLSHSMTVTLNVQ